MLTKRMVFRFIRLWLKVTLITYIIQMVKNTKTVLSAGGTLAKANADEMFLTDRS